MDTSEKEFFRAIVDKIYPVRSCAIIIIIIKMYSKSPSDLEGTLKINILFTNQLLLNEFFFFS